MFKVSVISNGNKVLGEIIVDSYFFDKTNYDYAYYFFNNNQRVDFVRYSDSMRVQFCLKEMTGLFFIKLYIRDKRDGSKRTFNSEKLSIDS